MKGLLEHKGYRGAARFDSDVGVYFGQIIGIQEEVRFEGKRLAELEAAFREAVEALLERQRERGERL